MTKDARGSALLFTVGALSVLLCGCGGGETMRPEQESGSGTPAAHSAPAAPASPSMDLPKTADGTDLGACQDADCEVEVKQGDTIPMDGEYGVDELVMREVTPDYVTVDGTAPGVSLSTSMTTGGGESSGNLNDVQVTVLGTDDDHAVVRISHT
ncbi:hypothetical protein [Nocardiopsis ansamitocini]|uniref:Uncharacterized protein n=1 Tax=Nocardiopsis ansamitocini TaxID=1670832 RepID=A0A9W6PA76_9ACTN|nr:hypothetical protein [Nocardiopsis ansamitocini]GLU49961.1 hypothetical protein Nans01_43120 [Nocardiopsis ansamitocini]